ncbi:MAG TPA: DUF1203 domain-containing protein [Arenimonas sp.]|jgi:hypothetical protein|nr:DUF1203 domain-containing protein [Arenimonas sp.]
MDIRIRGLDPSPVQALFHADPETLAARRAVVRIADGYPGYPCRATLDDAQPGETVLLLHHTHQPADTPFHASHAVYFRQAATRAWDALNEVPPALARRTLSLRAFDAAGWMVGSKLTAGVDMLAAARDLLANPRAAYLHAHYAGPGCYAAWVGRADAPGG